MDEEVECMPRGDDVIGSSLECKKGEQKEGKDEAVLVLDFMLRNFVLTRSAPQLKHLAEMLN